MVSKVQERLYAEEAAKLLGVNWRLVDIPEPLDFEVQDLEGAFGLEVRQVFVDTEEAFGSPSKRIESANRKLISALAKRYYALNGPPISAKLLGAVSTIDTQVLAESMVTSAPLYSGYNATIETQGVKVFMTPLPASWGGYSRWILVSDMVGWLRPTTSADLQYAVDRKKNHLPLYKQKYESIDLLLVADRTLNSGKLVGADRLAITNPGFRAIYFMSFPETIQRVG